MITLVMFTIAIFTLIAISGYCIIHAIKFFFWDGVFEVMKSFRAELKR